MSVATDCRFPNPEPSKSSKGALFFQMMTSAPRDEAKEETLSAVQSASATGIIETGKEYLSPTVRIAEAMDSAQTTFTLGRRAQ